MIEEYPLVNLGQLVELRQGFAINKKSDHYLDSKGIPLLRITDLINNTEAVFVKESIPSQFITNKTDIVFTRTGQVGLVFKGRVGVLHNNCFKVIPVSNLIDREYLYWVLKSFFFRDIASSLASGVAQPDLNHAAFKSIKIPLPGVKAQKKIVAILSAYDELIENNLERINLLEEMAQITYEEWFVRMKFPGYEEDKTDSETGLSEGWKYGCVTDICYVNSDSITTKNAPETIKYIDIASVNTGSYEEPESMSFSDAPSRARRKVRFGDTIFSTVRPNRKTYCLILGDTDDVVASTGFAALRPKEEHLFSFVYLSVANQDFVDGAVAVAGGAAYPAVKQSDFEKIKVIVPTQKLIKQFCIITNKLFEAISSLTKQNSLLQEARDILLPRLITGMIDLDNVELPEALLERVNK